MLALLRNQPENARYAFEAQIRVADGNALAPYYHREALLGFAALAATDGLSELAATLEAASNAHTLRAPSVNEAPVYDRIITRYLEPARESLDTPARKRAEARGRALTVAAAVQLAAGLTPDATG